jgi:hypothetical protein
MLRKIMLAITAQLLFPGVVNSPDDELTRNQLVRECGMGAVSGPMEASPVTYIRYPYAVPVPELFTLFTRMVPVPAVCQWVSFI